MTKIIHAFDQLTEWVGRFTAFLAYGITAVTFLVVVLRYGFQANALGPISSVALQESVLYMHAALFMLASGYTLKHNGHVRVDVVYRKLGARGKAWVDLLGTLFLLFPVSGFILFASLDFVEFAWKIRERSSESEGLAYLYLLKTLIPLMAGLLIWQGIAEALRNLHVLLSGKTPTPTEPGR